MQHWRLTKKKQLRKQASQNTLAVLNVAVAFSSLLTVQDSVIQEKTRVKLHVSSGREKHEQEQLANLLSTGNIMN